MLILLIRSHCKICPLPTIQISRVCILGNCWQWANFAMVSYEQNHYLRQKVCLYIYKVVLLRCLPSLDGRLERFVTKKMEKSVAKLESDRLKYSQPDNFDEFFRQKERWKNNCRRDVFRTLQTSLLQIFFKIFLNSKVINESIIDPDNSF